MSVMTRDNKALSQRITSCQDEIQGLDVLSVSNRKAGFFLSGGSGTPNKGFLKHL